MKMKFYDFFLWYLRHDYFPQKKDDRKSILKNKATHILLFAIAFLAVGFLNGFRFNIKEKLDDPYFNSIPAYAGLVKINEALVQPKYSNIHFDPFTNLGDIRVLDTKGDTLSIRGLALPENHPYLKIIEKRIIKKYSGDITQDIKNKCVIIKKDILYDKLLYSDFILNLSSNPKIEFIELGRQIFTPAKSIPIYATCKNMPNDVDFVIYEDFLSIENNSVIESKIEEKKQNWTLIINDKSCNFDTLYQEGEVITGIITKMGYKNVVAYPIEKNELPGMVVVNFDLFRLTTNQIENIVQKINIVLKNSKNYSGDSVRIFITKEKKVEVVEKKDESKNDWRYFTVTPELKDRNKIYDLKKSLEKDFKDLRLDMRSIDIVYGMFEIDSIVYLLEIFFLLLIAAIMVIINHKTLIFHLFKRKQHMAYLKNMGVSLNKLQLIYTTEAAIETFVSFFIAFGIALLFDILPERFYGFSYKSFEIYIFTVFLLLLNVIVYRYIIKSILKRPFREIIGSA